MFLKYLRRTQPWTMLQISLTEVFSCLSIISTPQNQTGEQIPMDELKLVHKHCCYTAQATAGTGTALFSRSAAVNQNTQFPVREGIKFLMLLDARSAFGKRLRGYFSTVLFIPHHNEYYGTRNRCTVSANSNYITVLKVSLCIHENRLC